MTYLHQADIARDPWMLERVAQCAAEQDIPDPDEWTQAHSREWAAAPGWDAAWESALISHEGDAEYQPGRDEAVITDHMILSQVQAMSAA